MLSPFWCALITSHNMLNILRYVGCNDKHIKNIIISNPYYLERLDRDVLKLIKYLKEIGLSSLGLIFDMNPFLLNKDDFEIKEYVNKRINDGKLLDDIIDEIESNPYVFEEV